MSGSNCSYLTCTKVSQEPGKLIWYSHLFKNFPEFVVIHKAKGFHVVNKAEVNVFLEFPCFLYDPMMALWSLAPLPFLNPDCTSGSSWFTNFWSLASRIWGITLLACEWAQFFGSLNILWPPDAKNWLIEKNPEAGKDWKWEEKGMTEDEMVRWHHQLNGHEFAQTPGVGDEQGSLACCSPWGRKELDMTEPLNWTGLSILWHCPCLGLERTLTLISLWPLLSFPTLLTCWAQHFDRSGPSCIYALLLRSLPFQTLNITRNVAWDQPCPIPEWVQLGTEKRRNGSFGSQGKGGWIRSMFYRWSSSLIPPFCSTRVPLADKLKHGRIDPLT